MIIGDITNPYFFEVARGVLDAADLKGYGVFVCNSDGHPEQEIRALHTLANHAVDGIITFPAWENEAFIKAFANDHPPIVAINRPFEHPGIGLVLTDIRKGARLAVDHLVGRGHSTIAMLAGEAPSLDTLQRVQGYRDGIRAHGLETGKEWILTGRPTMSQGYASTLRLLMQHPEITAIFAYNDLIALGAIQACRERGRRVPDDCAIVGFDDFQFAAMVKPALTTIGVDKYELGRQATNLLLNMLHRPKETHPPIHLDVELVVRESA
jgi:LacI family transcriptional regulator